MDPQAPVTEVKGVGSVIARRLRSLGIETVEDLLFHCPREFQDRSRLQRIADLQPERHGCVRATVNWVSYTPGFYGRPPKVDALVEDGSGRIKCVWFGQPYMRSALKKGREYLFWGRVGVYKGLEFVNPAFEEADAGDSMPADFAGLVPVYPQTEGLSSKLIRKFVRTALDALESVPSVVPEPLLRSRSLLPRAAAFRSFHFPASKAEFENARRSLAYEEFLVMQTALALMSRSRRNAKGHSIVVSQATDARIRKRFPFAFTAAQERVIAEIRRDLANPFPMSRLLQGDVGSGKTAVALYAVLAAIANRFQASIMAPTEILAEQHYLRVSEYLAGTQVRIEFLRGAMPRKDKAAALERIASGQSHLVIGTHALIQDEVEFARLGLVVIDEQHKFGVLQRAALSWKGYCPDVLVMTATPIPRTLAMTVFSDLELSILDELPGGPRKVRNYWVPTKRRSAAYERLRGELAKGRQGFVMCPLIEESEKLEAAAATQVFEELRGRLAPYPVALLHGRMRPEEKHDIMQRFRAGEYKVLVSTSVIEVGIDVPAATVLLVEDCNRFGLSQLHQMRGRVGRGGDEASCIFIGDCTTEEAKRRIRALLRTNDGFEIAREDFLLRGPGEFFGTMQSGIPDLRVGDILRDEQILRTARKDAFDLVETNPLLSGDELAPLRETLERRYSKKLHLGTVG